jgi:3-oxoacyl-[acyl-carrier protein] reductase
MSSQNGSGKLHGRVALVTGGAQGIGAAEAIRLAEEGAKVAVLDLSEEAARGTVEKIESFGGTAIALGADVSRAEQVEEAVARVVREFGRLDILVNNAGIIRDNLLFKMSEEDWDRVIDVHLKGSFLCSKAAQKYMVEQNYGRIVMTSSIGALGNRGQTNYTSAKAGLQGMARTMAIELGRFGITVNAVAPGWIETEMLQETADRMGITLDEMRQVISKEIPLGRMGRPDDIASAVAFLVSDDASYISGQTLYVSGGPAGVM